MTIQEKLQQMKIENATRAAGYADAVIAALTKFAGKSITGNKKKITDAMQAIDPKLIQRYKMKIGSAANSRFTFGANAARMTKKAAITLTGVFISLPVSSKTTQ